MQEFKFDSSYLNYYQDRLERASDGTRVPGLAVSAALVDRLQVLPGQRILDVGCSFGRLLPVLSPLTDAVFGLEMSYDVVDVAARKEYRCVVRGSAEDSNLPSAYFSHLVLFGVFDCCDQAAALGEICRLLVPGGRALLTGKNANYHLDDRLALIAERNAWRKRFPNAFTYAGNLHRLLPGFGLKLIELLRFARRGDFGEMKVLPVDADPDAPFYEYAAIVSAAEGSGRVPAGVSDVSTRVSLAAQAVASNLGLPSAQAFFESDRLDSAAG